MTLLPEQRLQAFSDEQLEMVVEHWLYEAVRGKYEHVVEYAGPGDMGRDRVGYVGAVGTDPWDNYQCKQYKKQLTPTDLWEELGKLVFHVSRGDYTRPRNYAFVAPRGIGPKATDLISNPEKVRSGLQDNWDKYCASLCPLADIAAALAAFEFPDFIPIAGGRIVDDLRNSRVYPYFFGGGLTKPRPPAAPPPDEIVARELPYVEQLVAAYDDHSSEHIDSAERALRLSPFSEHLRSSRREFYCAESLREFSKDAFPDPLTFPELQDLICDGIRATVARNHTSGYERVLAACEQAVAVQLGDHPLVPEVNPADRSGICHQLANDDRVRWVP